MQKKQYDSLDLLKFVCSILIVFLHLNPFSKEGEFYYFSRALVSIGVPIFFVLSGFFFFRKSKGMSIKNVYEYEEGRLKKYVKRIFELLIFWIIPYFFVIDLWWIIDGNIGENILKYLHHILFGGSGFYLWYLVAQIVGMILCCVLRKYNRKISGTIVLILFFVGMVGTSYTFLIEGTVFQKSYDYYMECFYTLRNGVFFGLPCVYIGMLIAENEEKLSDLKGSVIFWSVSIVLMIVEFVLVRMQDMGFQMMQISSIILSISSVVMFLGFNIHIRWAKILRKLSFLIYVTHPLYIVMIPKVLNVLKGIDYYWYLWYWWQIPVIVGSSIMTGLTIIFLSKRIKFLNKIM